MNDAVVLFVRGDLFIRTVTKVKLARLRRDRHVVSVNPAVLCLGKNFTSKIHLGQTDRIR
jgi:hypothetical protein